jgi:hypothetical protein
MGIEGTIEHADVRKMCKSGQRSIRAAVNQDNVLRPGEMGQRAADILFLIIRQQNAGNLLKHLQLRPHPTLGIDV